MKNSPNSHKKISEGAKNKTFLYALLSFFFPFVYYFHYIWPSSSLVMIGNDFVPIYSNYKAYFAELMNHGIFPLWSPAEVCGYSFFSNPFAAPLYLLNIIPVTVSKIFGNYNPGFHQVFTILGVAIFSLGLYLWLKDSFGEDEPAFFTAAVISASWSISGFLRLSNAIHTIAWVPWVLFVMNRLTFVKMKRSFLIGSGVFLILCQITAGYPYFVVYSYLLYAGYFAFLYSNFESWKNFKRSFINIACMLIAPVFLAAPYIASIKELLSSTVDRSGGNFAYSTAHAFGPFETLASFLYPPAACVDGCVYAGIITAFFVFFYFLKSKKICQKLFLLVGIILIFTIAYGSRSYLFTFFWNFLPVFGSMRVFPRITIILLPIMAVAIYQGYLIFLENTGHCGDMEKHSVWMPALILVAISGILYLTMPAAMSMGTQGTNLWIPANADKSDFLMYGILTLLSLIVLAKIEFTSFKRGRTIFLLIVLLIATIDSGSQGRFLWSYPLKDVFNKHAEIKFTGNDMRNLLGLLRL